MAKYWEWLAPPVRGKSVLLHAIVGLIKPQKGRFLLFGQDSQQLDQKQQTALRQRWGVLFQDGALFSSLTIAQNIQVPLKEHTGISPALREDISRLKLELVGLDPDVGDKYPSELSGGMRKRAGLARALALDPPLLFLDEPTAGLDPIGAAALDELIAELQQNLNLTVFMVTHDLDSLYAICDRIAVLGEHRVLTIGPLTHVLNFEHPWVRDYFHGPRSRNVADE